MLSKKKIRDSLSKANLRVENISQLGHGDDSDVFLADDLYVVKIPKREEVRTSQAREFLLYDYLENFSFDFEIPKAIFKSRDINVMSYIKGGQIIRKQYDKLSEKEKDALAYDEANFLKQLHSVKIDYESPIFAQTKQDKRKALLAEQNLLISILKKKKLISLKTSESVGRIYESLGDKNYLFDYSYCLNHNDFSADNMIFEKNRLKGVIDFGDFVVGDCDNDFLCLLDNSTDDLGKDFGRRVLKCYGHRNPEIAQRKAQLNDLYYPCRQIILGYKRNNSLLLLKGFRKLKKIDIKEFQD